MIKYFKQQNWENLKAYINVNDKGELFTGIKEKLDLNKNIYFRISYVNNFEHGLIYDFCFREYTWYIYIYGVKRFTLGLDYIKNTHVSYYNLSYDFISFDDFRFKNGENIEQLNYKILLNRNDLNYEKLIVNNKDVIDKYHSYDEDGPIDLDTFVYVHGDVERYSKVIVAYAIHNQMKEYLGKVIPDRSDLYNPNLNV